MATELNYPSNPIDGYVVLDNLILPPETFAALRALAISKAQSPEAMARQLIEQSLSRKPSAEARRASASRYTLDDLD